MTANADQALSDEVPEDEWDDGAYLADPEGVGSEAVVPEGAGIEGRQEPAAH